MPARRAFLAAASALFAAGSARAALAFVESPASGEPRAPRGQTLTLQTVEVIAATHARVRTAWRPPALFPDVAPVAYYAGRGGDKRYPDEPVIWLNPDHPELISPRTSRLTDEIPLFTELLLASVDVRGSGQPSLGLENLDPAKRRASATTLASNAAVVAKYSPYTKVDDAEFARRAFAFAVLRQMTPEIGGVAPMLVAASMMPPEEPLAAYAGRDTDARAPRGWGVIHIGSPAVTESPRGYEAWVRAFVLATADRQPAESAVKRAYEAARAQDESARSDHYAARREFAAPYVTQVASFFGR
ncbi:MAG TPA: hypothetical protein VGX96_07620 [Candidatus Elarobacter sp.]|jgi:hypothetical protein|nr:hypothetical protein [Candidatus Elarobacter sp.]